MKTSAEYLRVSVLYIFAPRLSGRLLSGILRNRAVKGEVDWMIRRRSLVERHNPVLTSFNFQSPLSVGNGELAFTADVTGLQSFGRAYEGEETAPLCTMAQWGWHSFAQPDAEVLEPHAWPSLHGLPIPHYTHSESSPLMYKWLRENPHRLHLGQIGLEIFGENGSMVAWDQLQAIRQTLNLWSGTLASTFRVDGQVVYVETACHPQQDTLAFRVKSALWNEQRLHVFLAFPYGSPRKEAADWQAPHSHSSTSMVDGSHRWSIERQLDQDRYYVRVGADQPSVWRQSGEHRFQLSLQEGTELSWTCSFGAARQKLPRAIPAEEVFRASQRHWSEFWMTGGAVDFSGSADSRAEELERRVVLSQYLTAIQCAGSRPPQETGLTVNSWYGKFHLEMHWWHGVHFALWNRIHLLEKSLVWYEEILPQAKALARSQGFAGARWPKMVGPEGRDSPSPIGPVLVWQQPHPIYYAELCYRAQPDQNTLDRYWDIVMESANFLASFVHWEEGTKRWVLGPPLIPAQECHDPALTLNPTFELAYCAFGLRVAQQWRLRRGLQRQLQWDHVLAHLAELPVRDGLYLAHENCPDTFTNPKFLVDHPSMLGAMGFLSGERVDPRVMENTFHRVWDVWKFSEFSWGWDYPLLAMTATRLGLADRAIDALMIPEATNRYLASGHNFVRTPDLLQYLPANGGLLTAIALMAAGSNHEEAPDVAKRRGWGGPGFPDNGRWQVQWEGLRSML